MEAVLLVPLRPKQAAPGGVADASIILLLTGTTGAVSTLILELVFQLFQQTVHDIDCFSDLLDRR